MGYLVLALATWRITSLLVNEDGPWAMFARLRAAAGVTYDPETFQRRGDTVLAELFNCVWCMSVWVGLVWALGYRAWPQVALWAALPFALSAAAIVVEKLVRHA